jgi:hypothetical protein
MANSRDSIPPDGREWPSNKIHLHRNKFWIAECQHPWGRSLDVERFWFSFAEDPLEQWEDDDDTMIQIHERRTAALEVALDAFRTAVTEALSIGSGEVDDG